MISHGRNIKIFAGNSYPELAADIANRLGLSVRRKSSYYF